MSTYYQLIESYIGEHGRPVLQEAKSPRKSDLKRAVRKALKDAGYNTSKYCKDAVVYTDESDFKKNQKNMWGGVSGDVQKMGTALKSVGPGNIVDVFVYDRCYSGPGGPGKGSLIDNVVVHLPVKRGQGIKKARQGTAHVYRADLYTDIQESASYSLDSDIALIEASVIDMEMGLNGRLGRKQSAGSKFLKGAAAVALITAVAMVMKKFLWPSIKSMFGRESASEMTAAASKALVGHVVDRIINDSKMILDDFDAMWWTLDAHVRLDVKELMGVVAEVSGVEPSRELEKSVRSAVGSLAKLNGEQIHDLFWAELVKRNKAAMLREIDRAIDNALLFKDELDDFDEPWIAPGIDIETDPKRILDRIENVKSSMMGPHIWAHTEGSTIPFMIKFPFTTLETEVAPEDFID